MTRASAGRACRHRACRHPGPCCDRALAQRAQRRSAPRLLVSAPHSAAIDEELAQLAASLGYADARALRAELTSRVYRHFESGGGGVAHMLLGAASAAAPVVRAYARVHAALAALMRRLCAAFGTGGVDGSADAGGGGGMAPSRVDVGRALRTLVRVHGVALLLDGVWNADPHPGNVRVQRARTLTHARAPSYLPPRLSP